MGTCASLRRRTCVHACLSPYACIYLRVYMRIRVSAWLRAWECVRMCEHSMCLRVCVHVYTRARVVHLCVQKGKTTFSRVLFCVDYE